MNAPAFTARTFIPIDTAARDGKGKLLRAKDETLHSGRWDETRGAFVYHGGMPIARPITHYSSAYPLPGIAA